MSMSLLDVTRIAVKPCRLTLRTLNVYYDCASGAATRIRNTACLSSLARSLQNRLQNLRGKKVVSQAWLFAVALLALTVPLAFAARAEENCGVMLVTSTHVDGVVEVIEPLAAWSGAIVDTRALDPRYVVSISVTGVESSDDKTFEMDVPAMKGRKLNFAIHSPSQFFGNTPRSGDAIHLQLETILCDGVFRRISEISVSPSSTLDKFNGNLEVGMTYQAPVKWSEEGALELTTPIQVPFHHGSGITWKNPQDLPKPGSHRRTQTIVFKVESKEIRQVAERGWVSIFNCKIRH